MRIVSEEENVRIDQYLSEHLDLSRSKVQKLVKAGKVKVNGEKVSNHYLVSLDETIEVLDDLDFEMKLEKENLPLNIVYEDDYLLIVNKESGMVVHPAPGNYAHTLVNALLYRFSLSNDALRPGIVHRIDKDTSGLLIVAKDDKTHEMLSEMIKKKEVERIYYALVDGVIPNDSGTIDAPIGRDPNNRQKMTVTDVNAKDAVTHFQVLKRFAHHTLIACKLETGRTHQIRVHMAYIGYPITNDPVYNRHKATSFGQMLHSWKLVFTHPITKKRLSFEVEPPKEFQEYLTKLAVESVGK